MTGPDGCPSPLWDPETGIIDKGVAEYWREHYDLSHILLRDWDTLGPRVRGKLHFVIGMMDTYYLNEAVYLVQDFLDSATNPPSGATFQYGFRGLGGTVRARGRRSSGCRAPPRREPVRSCQPHFGTGFSADSHPNLAGGTPCVA